MPQVFWMVLSCVPYPETLVHMWRMLSEPIKQYADEPIMTDLCGSLAAMRAIAVGLHSVFPVLYFAMADGILPPGVGMAVWVLAEHVMKITITMAMLDGSIGSLKEHRAQLWQEVDDNDKWQVRC